MSDTIFIICLIVLAVGLFWLQFMIAIVFEKIRWLEDDIGVLRLRILHLEKLHKKKGGEE